MNISELQFRNEISVSLFAFTAGHEDCWVDFSQV